MFSKMGDALYKEGVSNKDYVTASIGNVMIGISSITLSLEETRLLGELSAMISSKRLVNKFKNSKNISDGNIIESFEDFMRKINKENRNDDTPTE